MMRIYNRVEEWLVFLLFGTLIGINFINVVLRYLFGQSIVSIIELSGLLFAWLTFVGCSLAFKYVGHIRMDVIDSWLPERIRRKYDLFVNIILLISFVIIIIYGMGLSVSIRNSTIDSLGVSLMWQYLSLPIGFLLMSFRMIVIIFGQIRNKGAE